MWGGAIDVVVRKKLLKQHYLQCAGELFCCHLGRIVAIEVEQIVHGEHQFFVIIVDLVAANGGRVNLIDGRSHLVESPTGNIVEEVDDTVFEDVPILLPASLVLSAVTERDWLGSLIGVGIDLGGVLSGGDGGRRACAFGRRRLALVPLLDGRPLSLVLASGHDRTVLRVVVGIVVGQLQSK